MKVFNKNENKYFAGIFFPAIIFFFLSILNYFGIDSLKILTSLFAVFLTIIILFKKLENYNISFKVKIKYLFFLGIFEFLIFFLTTKYGVPTIPYFISPFNNLYFYGVISLCIYIYFKKMKRKNEENIKKFTIFLWICIFIYQFSIK